MLRAIDYDDSSHKTTGDPVPGFGALSPLMVSERGKRGNKANVKLVTVPTCWKP
jgi:hypothetical protein